LSSVYKSTYCLEDELKETCLRNPKSLRVVEGELTIKISGIQKNGTFFKNSAHKVMDFISSLPPEESRT